MTEQEEKDLHDRLCKDGVDKHFCLEFDGMYICDRCPEFDVCLCFSQSGHPERIRRDGKTYIQIPCREDNCTRQDQLLLSVTDDVYRLYCDGCNTDQDHKRCE